ncbi:hypothetical protein [Rhodovulum steppense]|uniref:Uncharacterized protein n=1 Tax=Rhodovulum steppense TaxID=540251 RepID=A0A4R1Z190_9RHOB|nr:hypothetical protein [Rhodovulum steppense]TCM86953.1 hypothetical protein EV216_10330 [Rhodovulum steppense]
MQAILFLLLLSVRLLVASWRVMVPVLLVASLAFNVALFSVQGLYTAAAGALAGAGIGTKAVREAASRASRQAAQREIVRETSQRVTRRVKRGAARSMASAAGEAIPFIGVGVIAGGLVWEVHDACETARNMSELEAALTADDDPEAARVDAEDSFDCSAIIPDFDNVPTSEVIWAEMRKAPGKAYDAARSAGIAVTEVDWSGWAGRVNDSMLRWLEGVGHSIMDKPETVE